MTNDADSPLEVTLTVNGETRSLAVAPRTLLSDLLRDGLGLTGTHVGCEHGVCGACTVVLDGCAARSCLTFAVQVNGSEVITVEGLAGRDEPLAPIQQAFIDHYALQCGFCTPGFLMTLEAELGPGMTEDEIRDLISANLCRCTGYQGIMEAAIELAGNKQ